MGKNQSSGGGDNSEGRRNLRSRIVFAVCRKNAPPAGRRQNHPAQGFFDSILAESAIEG
jgi:hypothetical protein